MYLRVFHYTVLYQSPPSAYAFSAVGLSVCNKQDDYFKNYKRILMKFSGEVSVTGKEMIRFCG